MVLRTIYLPNSRSLCGFDDSVWRTIVITLTFCQAVPVLDTNDTTSIHNSHPVSIMHYDHWASSTSMKLYSNFSNQRNDSIPSTPYPHILSKDHRVACAYLRQCSTPIQLFSYCQERHPVGIECS